jgi:hypothetical protein
MIDQVVSMTAIYISYDRSKKWNPYITYFKYGTYVASTVSFES